jgi:hypothetical protein
MDHGKGAGTTEPAPVGPAGDAGPIKPGGTKTPLRPYGLVTLVFVRDPGQYETLHGSRQPREAATQLGYAHPGRRLSPPLPTEADGNRTHWQTAHRYRPLRVVPLPRGQPRACPALRCPPHLTFIEHAPTQQAEATLSTQPSIHIPLGLGPGQVKVGHDSRRSGLLLGQSLGP